MNVCHHTSAILHLKAFYEDETSLAIVYLLVSGLCQPTWGILCKAKETTTVPRLHWCQVLLLSFLITHFIVILLKSCLNSSLPWKVLSYFCLNSSIAPLGRAMEGGWVWRPHSQWHQHPATSVGNHPGHCAVYAMCLTITSVGTVALMQYQRHVY